MKNVSLKKMLNMFALCAIVTASFSCVPVKADVSEACHTDKVAKTNEIVQALSILNLFKKYITAFFDKNNKEAFTQHVKNFGEVVSKVEALANEIELKYDNTGDDKYDLLLEIISEIEKDVAGIYKTLNQKYSNALSLSLALSKATSKHTDPAKVAALEKKLKELKLYLDKNEITTLKEFITTLKSVANGVPTNKLVCISRIKSVLNRK